MTIKVILEHNKNYVVRYERLKERYLWVPSTIETEKCMAVLKYIDGDQCHLFSQSNWVSSNQR